MLSLLGVVEAGEPAPLLEADPDVPLADDEPDEGIDELDVEGVELVPAAEPVPDGVELDIEPLDDGGEVVDEDGGVVDDDDGGVVVDEDDDGDGVTVGGDVVLDVLDSRWQPATPNARPVQSNVINVALLIVQSPEGFEGERCFEDLAESVPLMRSRRRAVNNQMSLINSAVLIFTHRFGCHECGHCSHVWRSNCTGRR